MSTLVAQRSDGKLREKYEKLGKKMIRKKICFVSTVPIPLLVFMREHVEKLSEYYDITLLCSGDGQELKGMLNDRVVFQSIPIERKIKLGADIRALLALLRIFRQQKFDCVHSLMPKAGLLAMLASWLTRVPVRIHIFTGQVWFAKSGLSRAVLKWMDRIVAACATHLMADSPSQSDFLVAEKVVPRTKITVLGQGSISGVDVERFKFDADARRNVRAELDIAADAIVFLFLARMTRVKGILNLSKAFAGIEAQMPRAQLLIVGPDEEELAPLLEKEWAGCAHKVHRVNYTNQPERYMSAADIFCLPSYLEGFSSATIQAAGVGLPAIVSHIYGLTDAVKGGVTGIFHEAGDILEMQNAMRLLYTDECLRQQMGAAAQRRAYQDFSQEVIVEAMRDYYQQVIGGQEKHDV